MTFFSFFLKRKPTSFTSKSIFFFLKETKSNQSIRTYIEHDQYPSRQSLPPFPSLLILLPLHLPFFLSMYSFVALSLLDTRAFCWLLRRSVLDREGIFLNIRLPRNDPGEWGCGGVGVRFLPIHALQRL